MSESRWTDADRLIINKIQTIMDTFKDASTNSDRIKSWFEQLGLDQELTSLSMAA